MAQIISITNQKGGVGKTTTAVNLAATLAVSERRVLLVDSDPQGNATSGLGIDKNTLDATLYNGLIGQIPPEELICDTAIETLKIIPSRIDLTGFEVEMMGADQREAALKKLLAQIDSAFDIIIIDCPPALSLLTVNAFTAANSLLITLQCEFYALEGLSQLLKTFERIKYGYNPGLRVLGILLTMYDVRTNLSQQVAEEAENYFKTLVFKTRIPRNVRLAEAPSFGKPILLYAATSTGAASYMQLAQEVLSKISLNKK